jgi:aminoglycoside phosphotransferase (APT) family kinase protein
MSDPADPARHPEATRALGAFPGLASPGITPIRTGLIHETYGIEDGGRAYILQRINPIFSPGVQANIAAVTRHLEQKGLRTLRLLESQQGRPWADLGEAGRWRLMTRLPGFSYDRCEDPEQARRAGALVAAFHSALHDFGADLEPIGFPFHDTRHHLDQLAAALREHPEHPLAGDVIPLAERIFEASRRWQPPRGLVRRVIHGDLKFNNILFEEPGAGGAPEASALIDLDTLARMPLYFDWGDAWRSWCNRAREDEPEAALDLSLYRGAVEGLMSGLGFDPGDDERESLTWGLECLSLELCARFAEDALRESYFGWDAERFGRAGEQHLQRARGQLSLHQQALETHDERARFLLG